MNVSIRNNIKVSGTGQPLLFAHGFGCDQTLWLDVAPHFVTTHQVIIFDYVGSGKSDLNSYDSKKYSTLSGYAQDVLDIIKELNLKDVIFVGHSVSSMIGLLASIEMPNAFSKLIMVGPSPCFINDGEYYGGFARGNLEGLIDALHNDQKAWAEMLAPIVVGVPEKPELTKRVERKFCAIDSKVAENFARATFLSDHRKDLPLCSTDTLILQCSDDKIAPIEVGLYLHEHLPNNSFVQMNATGHFPQLTAPAETINEIKHFLLKTLEKKR